MTITQWSEKLNIPIPTIWWRLDHNWSTENVLSLEKFEGGNNHPKLKGTDSLDAKLTKCQVDEIIKLFKPYKLLPV